MLLAELVKTSHQIGATSKRLEKTDLLAGFLRRLRPDELVVTVSYLSGRTPQGKVGIGWSTIQDVGAPRLRSRLHRLCGRHLETGAPRSTVSASGSAPAKPTWSLLVRS